ncbi:hypothetical protein C8Q80DRAFT_1115857 [Daedaleopsis nitida]|nr:hypothetical protein C8Q80DRAFT_1115857 [Daedaleopsis nitida]
MVVTTKAQTGSDATKKTKSVPKKKGSAGGRKKLTEFNKFMQTEVARLKQENPDLPHKERFKLVIDNWKKQKEGNTGYAFAVMTILSCLEFSTDLFHPHCISYLIVLEPQALAMSQAHDIDNDAPFYIEFDSYEPLNGSHRLEGYSYFNVNPHSMSVSQEAMDTASLDELDVVMNAAFSNTSKGKGISQPLDILQRYDPAERQVDQVPVVGGSSSSAGHHTIARAWIIPPRSIANTSDIPFLSYADDDAAVSSPVSENVGEPSGISAKGKGRERPPMLPPLEFAPTAFEHGSLEWSFDMSPQTAGPSSYGSGFASLSAPESMQGDDVTPPISPDASTPLEHVSTRPRSLSNLSIRSTRSLSALSISKVKAKFAGSKAPRTIARKLLFRKGREASTDTNPTPATAPTEVTDTEFPGNIVLGRGSCFLPWAPPLKSCTSPPVGTLVDIDVDLSCGPLPPYRPGPLSGAAILRAKGRSYSSPFPLSSSPLDIVPLTPAEISEPIPIETRNYFDEELPPCVVNLHEVEHLRTVSSSRWTAIQAGRTRNKWVGAEKGVRELLKLRRVSKAWQSLVYDGQLWTRLPKLPTSILERLAESAGGFVRAIDFTGLTSLSSDTFIDLTNDLSLSSTVPTDLSCTRITTLDLQGCTGLTSRALHYILVRSPALQKLCVKGLNAVVNNTCTILSTYCPRLSSLDVSRCINLDGEGIRSMASAVLDRGDTLRLKVLRLNWLDRVTDQMMNCLGKAAPDLEVLDLSYSAPLHNSAIEAFVSLTEEESRHVESVQLTAREAGRDPADPNRYWRRVTRLRHLAVSSCILLTDHACSHLAYAVPKLEFLELAGIGADLQDDGLVRLFNTTPYIRRVDLEDATEISDTVLAALTPPRPDENAAVQRRGAPPAPPQPGHALEHLVISHAANVSNDALVALVRNCTKLRVLEADNTRMNGLVMREFVTLARERRLADACLAAIDCRGVGEHAVQDVAAHTRPRRGWRAWEARDLRFLDGRDEEGLGVGQDECDAGRVVLKTFYSWQTVDAVRAAREKRRKVARRAGNGSGSSEASEGGAAGYAAARTRWWSPSGRRSGRCRPSGLGRESRRWVYDHVSD